MDNNDYLRQFASVRQLEYLDAIDAANGSIRAASKVLGIHHATVSRSIVSLKNRAATKDRTSHLGNTVPDPYIARGYSTYFNKEGQPAGQWVKTTIDDDKRAEMMRAVIDSLCDELPRVAPTAPVTSAFFDSLCNVYTLTDSHVGMLAWGKETGEPWDLKIAEDTLTRCFEHMVGNSPPARVAVVNQLGDFLHYDGLLPLTPTSGHVLDSDGRAGKMVDTALSILRHVISFALARHEHVVVLMAEGNHDPMGSVWLRKMFKAMYENEPRVTVIDSELPYYAYQHGKTMLAFHHGHLTKNDSLPLLFAAQFAPMWGTTTKRYAHTGHRHHVEEKEHNGMIVHQHTTLAARDAYAARGGWVAGRGVTSMTYHAEFGEVARNTVTPEMLSGAV